jgi:hypothetical protein
MATSLITIKGIAFADSSEEAENAVLSPVSQRTSNPQKEYHALISDSTSVLCKDDRNDRPGSGLSRLSIRSSLE